MQTSHEIEQVRRFYTKVWNQHDKTVIPQLLHEDFTFRSSLGAEMQGHAAFIDYLDRIHQALSEYLCIIDELLADENKVFAKMTFTGMHTGTFIGYVPTGKSVSWLGAALFTFYDGKISDLWVLGDLQALESQLAIQSGIANQ